LEQQAPSSWSEIASQPLFRNRLLTNELGSQWGTKARSRMRTWAEKGYHTFKDIARDTKHGWKTFPELSRLRRTRNAPNLYTDLINSIPWESNPMPIHTKSQWVAQNEEADDIQFVPTFSTPSNKRALFTKKNNHKPSP
jgi:hypothetical protein